MKCKSQGDKFQHNLHTDWICESGYMDRCTYAIEQICKHYTPAEPAQDHGYKVGDVVAIDDEEFLGQSLTIREFNRMGHPELDHDTGCDAGWCDVKDLTPLHRCPTEGWDPSYPFHSVDCGYWGLGSLACTCGSRVKTYYLTNPPGAPGEPFLACSERPHCEGTWLRFDAFAPTGFPAKDIDEVSQVLILRNDLWYEFISGARVRASECSEARPPLNAIKCEREGCGQFYNVPKGGRIADA